MPTPPIKSVCWFLGVQGTEGAEPRTAGMQLRVKGWRNYVAQFWAPLKKWSTDNGIKPRAWLDEPGGSDPGGPFQLTQFLNAGMQGCPWLLNEFVDAWGPETAAGAEIIGYVGCPETDRVVSHLTPFTESWMTLIQAALSPLTAARMSIALDAAFRFYSTTGAGSASQQLLAHLFGQTSAYKGKVYGEPWPDNQAATVFGSYGCITSRVNYQQQTGSGAGPKRWPAGHIWQIQAPWFDDQGRVIASTVDEYRACALASGTPSPKWWHRLPSLAEMNKAIGAT